MAVRWCVYVYSVLEQPQNTLHSSAATKVFEILWRCSSWIPTIYLCTNVQSYYYPRCPLSSVLMLRTNLSSFSFSRIPCSTSCSSWVNFSPSLRGAHGPWVANWKHIFQIQYQTKKPIEIQLEQSILCISSESPACFSPRQTILRETYIRKQKETRISSIYTDTFSI
jgi:hypothetical protein